MLGDRALWAVNILTKPRVVPRLDEILDTLDGGGPDGGVGAKTAGGDVEENEPARVMTGAWKVSWRCIWVLYKISLSSNIMR